MTQHLLPVSRPWLSLPPLFPFAASSSSIMSAGRTDMCTTLGFSALKWYSRRDRVSYRDYTSRIKVGRL